MRRTSIYVSGAFLLLYGILGLAAAAPVRTEQQQAAIEKAVQGLSGAGDQAREQAVRTLLQAGAHAIEPLEDAAWGDDAELAFQAGKVLRMIELGLDPETPDDVRKLAEGFHEPDNKSIRPLILQRLTERGEHGLQSIRSLVLSERDEKLRGGPFATAAAAMMPDLPEHILAGEMQKAEAILWIWAGTGQDDRMADLAAFLRSADRMADALSVTRNWSEGLPSPFRCTLQAFVERAAGNSDRAVEAARRSGQAYLVHVMLIESGRWKEFAEAFDEFLAARANVGGVSYLLSAHRLAGNARKFDTTIDRLMQFARRDEDSVGQAAAALLFNGQADMAADLLALHGEYDAAVQIRLSQGEAQKAGALVEKWLGELSQGPGRPPYSVGSEGELPQQPFEFAGLLIRLGRNDQALEVLDGLLDAMEAPTPIRQKAALVSLLHRAGQQEKAEELVLDLLADPELEDSGRAVLLSMVLPTRNLATLALWKSLAAMDPEDSPAETLARLRAVLSDEVGDEALAGLVSACIKFAEQNPHLWAQSQLAVWGKLCEQRGLLEDALGLYKAEHDLFSTTGALGRAALIAHELGRDDEAEGLSERSFESDPKTSVAMFLRSVLLRGTGRQDEAGDLLARADTAALARVWQRGHLAMLMERYAMPDAAHQQRRMIVQAGQFARLDLTAADLYTQELRKQGRLERARWVVEHQALGVMGAGAAASVEVLLSGYEYRDIYRVIELLKEGKTEEALTVARRIVGRSPGLADSLILLINELDGHGQKDVAEELFGRIWQAHEARRELFPGEASHYNTAAWVGTRCGRMLDECLALSRKSLEMDPFSPYFLDTLADVYFMRGDAETAFEKEYLSVHIDASSFTWRQYHRFREAARN